MPLLAGDRARLNDAMAGLVSDRVAALGAASLDDPDELRDLMARAAVRRGDHRRRPRLGARTTPFWAAAEETGALVFVHPTSNPRGFAGPDEHYLWNTVGNPTETTVTAAHLVMAGVLERHRDLRILLAHGGGALPWLRGRLRHAHEHLAAAQTAAARAGRGVAAAAALRHGHARRRTCCARWPTSPAPTAWCWAPTIRSTWATPTRWRRRPPPAWIRTPSAATRRGCTA